MAPETEVGKRENTLPGANVTTRVPAAEQPAVSGLVRKTPHCFETKVERQTGTSPYVTMK
jgi:hypothetical protein